MDRFDPQPFLATLAAHADWFDRSGVVSIARAPGRLDLMGGIADYSGSLVLQLPIAAAAWAAVQWTNDGRVHVRTTDPLAGEGGDAELPLELLLGSYDDVRARFVAEGTHRWAAYIAGAITVLHHERGVRFPRGVRWLVSSSVPVGKGVSSSAAIEVGAMDALCGALDLTLDGRELALLCQRVENLVVGAPCGVMDQMTAACGQANSLLALLCQPAEVQPTVVLPEGVEVFGIDSGIRHAVTGADYRSVRVGAFMGYRIVASIADLRVRSIGDRVHVEDPIWHGYLANVPPAEWASRFRDRVPERMRGAEFLAKYRGSTDTVTTIEPNREYAVRQPAAHPIYEHDRVRQFRVLLEQAPVDDAQLEALGDLMYQSHASYSVCGLGSDGTDRIVDLVRRAGPPAGLFGAKITGGGSGGTVAVLAREGSHDAIDGIAAEYARATGRHAAIVTGSSDGAVRWARAADDRRAVHIRG